MKADLYVQGIFWARIEIEAQPLLALLAQGIIKHATHAAQDLIDAFDLTVPLECSVSLRHRQVPPYTPGAAP